MSTLMRWDPSRDLLTMRSMMDRIVNEGIGSQSAQWQRAGEGMALALDVAEEDDTYIVKASLPGVKPEEIDVTLADNVLTIRGELKADEEIKDERYHVRERRWGTYMRSVTLPAPVNQEQIDANFEHGVLTLRLPKSEAVKPRRINVRSSIEGQSVNGHAVEAGANGGAKGNK
ncbi:MAG: Hsp20/alpha crystallin family protein [Caldilineaceae bacterium]